MSWGGRRKGAGRKAADGAENLVDASVRLSLEMWEYIDTRTGDSKSEKLRTVLREAMSSAPAATAVSTPMKCTVRKPAASPRETKLRELGLVERGGTVYFSDGGKPGLSFMRKHGLSF